MPKINLAGCVILENDSILLIRRRSTGRYELPGGKIENETPEETAIRELREELLVDVEIDRKIGGKNFKERGHTMGYSWFRARIRDGQSPQIGEPDKYDEFRYVPLADLGKYNLSSNMKVLAREYKKGHISLDNVRMCFPPLLNFTKLPESVRIPA